MNRIVVKKPLAPGTFLLEIEAPRIAARGKAGQFVILRPSERSERVPLTLVEVNPDRGTVTLVVQVVGDTTRAIGALEQGGEVSDLLGPLGQPTEIEDIGHVLCIGGGIGVAVLLPVARAMRARGNRVTALCGARSAGHMILKEEADAVADEVHWATDDGSFGFQGNIVQLMQSWIRTETAAPGLVHLVGPVPMMRAAANLTREWKVRTIASLNPIMIDGIGMCGGCRVSVGDESRFACVDGPEFDAHAVDFDDLARRNRAYAAQEKQAVCCHQEAN